MSYKSRARRSATLVEGRKPFKGHAEERRSAAHRSSTHLLRDAGIDLQAAEEAASSFGRAGAKRPLAALRLPLVLTSDVDEIVNQLEEAGLDVNRQTRTIEVEEDNLDALGITELRKAAKPYKIKGAWSLKSDALRAAIREARRG